MRANRRDSWVAIVTYFLNLFSPETYEAFSRSRRDTTGFRERQKSAAIRVKPGDRFICYMTKLSVWVGILEVTSAFFEDDAPIFYESDDPFIVRFHVEPQVWLGKKFAIPIREDSVWNKLSFTKEHDKSGSRWTGKLRASLSPLDAEDACFLEELLFQQEKMLTAYPFDEDDFRKLLRQRVRRADRSVTVTVPTDEDSDGTEIDGVGAGTRQSFQMQAILAEIGSEMGMKVWIPRSDTGRVSVLMSKGSEALVDRLPLNYDDTTLKTIEHIDVIWLKGRSIVRAFEVEHTTSIYSGLLRMADLLALQPNMDIKLNIVAPLERREKALNEMQRPVFSLLDRGPLSENCGFISYENLQELATQQHLKHFNDSVIDEYSEYAGDAD